MIDRLVILGSGAMASLFGARLDKHAEITLVGSWPAGVEALRRDGIQLETEAGVESTPVAVVSDPAALAGVRYALVLVKSWQTERTAAQLRQILAEDGVALTLQNGLGNRETLAAALGPARVLQGVTTYGAYLAAPGRVRPGGEGRIQIGTHAQARAYLELFAEAEMEAEVVEDLAGLAWTKLAVNAGINPLTALLRVPNGDLLALPGAPEVMARAVREVEEVARAKGIRLSAADPVAESIEVARRTGTNRSSMLQDIARGAPTEIDSICGAVVRLGAEHGVPTPTNWTLWQLVRAAAAGGSDA